MTKAQIESYCFKDRGYDPDCYESLDESDLRFKVGQRVYFKPLKEILTHPRVHVCSYDEDEEFFRIGVDEENTFLISPAELLGNRTIKEFHIDELYGKRCAYYTFVENNHCNWADDYMLSGKPPINKKLELMSRLRYIR